MQMSIRALLGLTVLLVINQQVKAASNICDSPKCVQEAAKIVDYIDTDANPCEDFYQFACGNFVANSLDKLVISDRLTKSYIHDLHLLLEDVHENDYKIVKLAKKLYGRCMKKTEISNDFVETVKQILTKVGGWPILEGSSWNDEDFDWLNATYKLRRLGYDYSAFFDIAIIDDENSKDKRIFQVIVGPSQYIENEDIMDMAIVALHLEGKDIEDSKKEGSDVYEFYQEHKMFSMAAPDPRHYIRQTVEKCQEGEDAIDWLEFINNMVGPKVQITKNDYIYFPNKQLLKYFKDLISNTPKRTLANYMMWNVIRPLLRFHPQCRGSPRICGSPEIRDTFCWDAIYTGLISEEPNPIDALALRSYASEEKQKTIENMVMKIISEFEETVNTIQWLPEETKQNVTDKVKNLEVIVGLPGKHFDDKFLDELDVDVGDVKENSSFFTLLAQANRNRQSVLYLGVNKLQPKHDYRRFAADDSIPTYHDTNILNIPIIAAKYFLYDENGAECLNYGTLGTLVGEALGKLLLLEMRTGQVLSETPNCTVSSLHDTDNRYFKEIALYTTFQYMIGQHVSYAVYQERIKANGVEPNLVATNYTPNQLFWISTASLKCAPTGTLKVQGADITPDMTKSSIFGISESLRQNPNFAKDFKCPVSSVEQCDVL